MLQQTQAQRVIPKWEAFCAAYPTPAACAAAPLGDVLRLWQGLGYPRRARNLHRAAVAIEAVARRGGSSRLSRRCSRCRASGRTRPARCSRSRSSATWRVVDTNIARVLARTVGRAADRDRGAATSPTRYVPARHGWVWNQVLMDLGASVCRPSPRCDDCPLAATCAWNRAGRPRPDPAVGSAGVSTRQAPYEGSDRQARGRGLLARPGDPVPAPRSRSRSAPTSSTRLLRDGLDRGRRCRS